MLKDKKESLRGKSEWREYFRGNRRKITNKQRNRLLQYAKERAKIAMEDLLLISKGLHYLTDSFDSWERAEKHRQEIFSMPLAGQCFIRFYVETKGRIRNVQEFFHERGQELVFDVRGYRVDQLKMKKSSSRR